MQPYGASQVCLKHQSDQDPNYPLGADVVARFAMLVERNGKLVNAYFMTSICSYATQETSQIELFAPELPLKRGIDESSR